MNIPTPIFAKDIPNISWEKIYEREYGVQYSEIALGILAFAKTHFPNTSIAQVVIPGIGGNTAFYIDKTSWVNLVDGLKRKYTSHVEKLEEYEKQFLQDGKSYVATAKSIARKNLETSSDKELLQLFLLYKAKQDAYSVFAWSAFILNNYVADRATKIIDTYIQKQNAESEKQDIYDSLFQPEKRAAILQLQYEVARKKGKLSDEDFSNLYKKYKWLSCLDVHNKAWTEDEFRKHIASFTIQSEKNILPFTNYAKKLKIGKEDLEYLHMAKRFVYIKDSRDDFRRESVFYGQQLFLEIGKRMGLTLADMSYVQAQEIIAFLTNKKTVLRETITQRKKGFVIYFDTEKHLVCLSGESVQDVLQTVGLAPQKTTHTVISGRVASQGKAQGKVVIVHGIKDIEKVETSNILVAVTTHPDYVSAMRKAAAIVTDEGGITSHAAIVAREFGIPCIVGCKNATQILKDGDMVEVDAVSGKVTKVYP